MITRAELNEVDARDDRLIPPPAEEYRVPVRFRYVGEEAPRIHLPREMSDG